MKEILANLALIDLTNFCKQNNIDCSGSHLFRQPRTFRYYLLRDKDGQTIATVTFHKNQIPTHSINPDLK